ncbi:unnamed protein product, partial [Bodo saltans]
CTGSFTKTIEVLRCIVSHESSGNAHAANYNSWDSSYDVGVWQVNTVNWKDCSGGAAPCNPSTNLQCAIDVWRWGGNTFRLWSTCGGWTLLWRYVVRRLGNVSLLMWRDSKQLAGSVITKYIPGKILLRQWIGDKGGVGN